jgi:hypothetical protein
MRRDANENTNDQTPNARMKTPNTKIQASKKSQCPKTNSRAASARWCLKFGDFLVFGVWCLVFGVWCFAPGGLVLRLPVPGKTDIATMNDLKFAFRQWLKNPGFTAVADKTFAAMAISRPSSFSWLGGGEAERVSGRWVSAEFFTVLGIEPALGRNFVPSDPAADWPALQRDHDRPDDFRRYHFINDSGGAIGLLRSGPARHEGRSHGGATL